jgi:hypothetical protein
MGAVQKSQTTSQKRAEPSAKNLTLAPVFCIWLLESGFISLYVSTCLDHYEDNF